jgi:small subunit ribosomal protein S21
MFGMEFLQVSTATCQQSGIQPPEQTTGMTRVVNPASPLIEILRWLPHGIHSQHIWLRIPEADLAEVRSQEGESIENLLRRFKRKVQTEDIIKDVKRHSFYLKPGEKKRVKRALAQKRARKKSRTNPDNQR